MKTTKTATNETPTQAPATPAPSRPKRHFLYAVTQSAVRRTYGGVNYKVTLWENHGRGKLTQLGTTHLICTSAHRGEEHEAWHWLFSNALTPRQQKRIVALDAPLYGNIKSYCNGRVLDAAGIKLDRLY